MCLFVVALEDVYSVSTKVKKGDTLFKLAMQFNVTKKEIMLVNKLVSEEVYEGQVRLISKYFIDFEVAS